MNLNPLLYLQDIHHLGEQAVNIRKSSKSQAELQIVNHGLKTSCCVSLLLLICSPWPCKLLTSNLLIFFEKLSLIKYT